MLSVYRMLRILYGANPKNPQSTFAVPPQLARGTATAEMQLAEANAQCIAEGLDLNGMEGLNDPALLAMTPEQLLKDYPLFASSLMNLIQNAENRMGYHKKPASK